MKGGKTGPKDGKTGRKDGKGGMKENKRRGGEETADRRQDGKSRQREKLQVDERTGREQA